jgi:hypothetical protein
MPYIKADQDKFINEKYIRWIQRFNDSMEVCVKFNGCTIGVDTIRVSKAYHPASYDRLTELTNDNIKVQKQEPLP